MKMIFAFFTLLLFSNSAFSCITCNKAIQDGIYNSAFYPNLLVMLSAFIVLAIVMVVLTILATKRYKARLSRFSQELNAVPLLSAGAVIGIGLGGFADGIVFHQILQWHELLTNKIPADTLVNKSVNMFWDGVFHAFTLIATTLGVYLLFKVLHKTNVNKDGRVLTGAIFIGWGIFNLIEGIIDHHILKLHNVYEYTLNKDLYNYAFLLSGIVLILVGWLIYRKGEEGLRMGGYEARAQP